MSHYAGKVRFGYGIQVLRAGKESANLSGWGLILCAPLEV